MNAFLAASLVKATLLLLATAFVLRALVRASAASRHLVAFLGLALALAVPVLGLVLPRWEIPVLSAAERPLSGTRVEIPDRPRAAELTGFSGRVGVQVPPLEEPAAAADPRPERPSLDLDVARVASLLWLLGGLVPLAALAIGFRRARALIRNAQPPGDPGLDALAAEVSALLGLNRSVPILVSPEALVPMTANFFSPVLVLPDSARKWPRERQRVVLLHELAHVARRDLGALLVAELTTAAYWFHPLAHVVARHLRRSAEEASDDLVLGNGTRASDYASHLVGIVRGLASPGEMPVLAMARPSDLEKRVRAILDPQRRRRAPSRLLAASLAVVGIAGALLLAAAVPGARPAMAALPAPDDPLLDSGKSTCPAKKENVLAIQAAMRVATKVATKVAAREAREERVVNLAEKNASRVVLVANRKDSGSAAFSHAKELYDDDRYLEAAEAYRKAVDLGYREDTAAYNAACSYALAGRKDDAFTWLKKSMELGFDIESYLRSDDDLDSLRKDPRFSELKKAARAAKAEGKTADSVRAVKSFERLTAAGSKNGARWYEAGKNLLDEEQLELSEKAFRTAASLGYRTGASTYNAACALARAGKVPQALDTLDAALEAGFDDPGLLGRDDDLEALHGDPRFAKLRKKAEDLTLSMSDVETGVSRLFRRRSAWREEVPHYAAYAKAHPESGRAHYNLGYAQLLAERPEAALPAFTRALELGYRKSATLYNLACTHARLEEKDKAFERLFQAIDAGFGSPSQIRHDEDLDSLHGDPRFKQALERASKDEEAED